MYHSLTGPLSAPDLQLNSQLDYGCEGKIIDNWPINVTKFNADGALEMLLGKQKDLIRLLSMTVDL